MPPTNATRPSTTTDLVVMAVHRPLVRVQRASGSARQRPELAAHRAAPSSATAGTPAPAHPPRAARGRRSARRAPRAGSGRRPASGVAQHEVRGHEPSGQMDVGTSPPELVHHLGERGLAVDQHVHAIARPGRRPILGPAPKRHVEHGAGQASQPPTMLRPHRRRDAVPNRSIDAIHHRWASAENCTTRCRGLGLADT